MEPQTGTGDPAKDLDRLRGIADTTAASVGFSTTDPKTGMVETCQRPADGSAGRRATISYAVALGNVQPSDAAKRVTAFWRQKGSGWVGERATVDDSQALEKFGRVHLYGGGWNVSAEAPLNEARGSYAILAEGPCY